MMATRLLTTFVVIQMFPDFSAILVSGFQNGTVTEVSYVTADWFRTAMGLRNRQVYGLKAAVIVY